MSCLPENSNARGRSLPIRVRTKSALDVEGESMGAFVDFERTKGGLVPTLRVLFRSSVNLRLWVAFHDLNRHVTVAGEDKQPGRVDPLNFPV